MKPWSQDAYRLWNVHQVEGAAIGRSIAEACRELEALRIRLDTLSRLCTQPGLGDVLMVEEGPFTSDAHAALHTTHHWIERASLTTRSTADLLAQAHIAAGGLASRLDGHRNGTS